MTISVKLFSILTIGFRRDVKHFKQNTTSPSLFTGRTVFRFVGRSTHSECVGKT